MFHFYPFVKVVSNSESEEENSKEFWINGFINGFIYGTLLMSGIFVTRKTMYRNQN
jgi:hypothetical protein